MCAVEGKCRMPIKKISVSIRISTTSSETVGRDCAGEVKIRMSESAGCGILHDSVRDRSHQMFLEHCLL